jgi:hypothetical protein
MVSIIGKAAWGTWKARDPRLNRDIAIKISGQQFTIGLSVRRGQLRR